MERNFNIRYREMLEYLDKKGLPPLATATQVQSILGIGHSAFSSLVAKKYLIAVCGKYPIGQVARLLCLCQ